MRVTLLIALSAILGSAYAECGCACTPFSAVENNDCTKSIEPGANGCGCANGEDSMCKDAVCNEPCVCPSYEGSINTAATSDEVKLLAGSGIGECDCEKGLAELRFVYLGTTPDADISIFTGKGTAELICLFENVQPYEEIICNLRGDAPGLVKRGLEKFDTQSPFTITYPAGETCEAEYHTSCSSDIVGIVQPECNQLIVSGWKDNKNYAIGDCDDGIEPCECDFTPIEVETVVEPPIVSVIVGDQCYCEREMTGTRRLAKLDGPTDGGLGLGVGDCECQGPQVTLKLMYQGVGAVDVEWFPFVVAPVMCENFNVQPGDEIECNAQQPSAHTSPTYDKLYRNTYVRLFEAGSTTERCQTEIVTSCSRDIVGSYGDGACGADVIVSGWKDKANLNNGRECDDGLDLCACDDTCGGFSTEPDDFFEGNTECDTKEGCFLNEETGSCANAAIYSERQAIDDNETTDGANSQNYFVAVVVSIMAAVRYYYII